MEDDKADDTLKVLKANIESSIIKQEHIVNNVSHKNNISNQTLKVKRTIKLTYLNNFIQP